MGEWECMECGYVAPGQKRPDLCPECESPAEAFEYFEYEEDDFEDFDDIDYDDEDFEDEEEMVTQSSASDD